MGPWARAHWAWPGPIGPKPNQTTANQPSQANPARAPGSLGPGPLGPRARPGPLAHWDRAHWAQAKPSQSQPAKPSQSQPAKPSQSQPAFERFFLCFLWIWVLGGLEWSKTVRGTRTIILVPLIPHIDHSRHVSTQCWHFLESPIPAYFCQNLPRGAISHLLNLHTCKS